MLALGSYTKEDIAKQIGVNTSKASNITKKLNNLGYKYTTEGKARNYRITIIEQPKAGIKEFAEQHLGINARFEDRLTHFLYLLFASGNGNQFANMSASALEWITYSNNDTIQRWLDALIDCGLLVEETLVDVYYATKKEFIEYTDYDTGEYTYTQLWKEITWQDYEKAIRAYSDTYKEYTKDIKTNPDIIEDEGIYYANMNRKAVLNGWWAKRKTANYKIEINTKHPKYEELLLLLQNYDFVSYRKEKTGNAIREQEEWQKRMEKWENEKMEKRKKLEQEANKPVPATTLAIGEVEQVSDFGTLKDNSEMPMFDDVREALLYLRDNYVFKGGFRHYEE